MKTLLCLVMFLFAHVTWAQEAPIATGGVHQHSPTGGAIVAWVEQPVLQNSPSNIFVRDSAGMITQVTDADKLGEWNDQPSVSGNVIAWRCRGQADTNFQICWCQFVAGTCPVQLLTDRLGDSGKDHGHPRAHLNRIVIQEGSPSQVVLHDLPTGKRTALGSGVYPDLDAVRGLVAYLRPLSGGGAQLRIVDFRGRLQIAYVSPDSPAWGGPRIDRQGDQIVLPRVGDLWLYGALSSSEVQLPLPGTQSQPAVYSGTLLWNDNPGFGSGIRGCKLPVCDPVTVVDDQDLHDVSPDFADENAIFMRMNTPLEGDVLEVPLPLSLQ